MTDIEDLGSKDGKSWDERIMEILHKRMPWREIDGKLYVRKEHHEAYLALFEETAARERDALERRLMDRAAEMVGKSQDEMRAIRRGEYERTLELIEAALERFGSGEADEKDSLRSE